MAQIQKKRIYIVGAGFAGKSIALEIQKKEIIGDAVAFLDDDPEKIGKRILNIPVLGPIEDVVSLLERTPADEALIAIPSATREQLKDIYRKLKSGGFAKIRILPNLSDIVDGTAHFIQTREIDSQDILGRTPRAIDLKKNISYIRGKRVLITGAGGSIGSELCRQLLAGGAERLYLFGHGENSIYEINSELKILQEEGVGERATIVPIIGELKDKNYVEFILKRLRADIIFHAAAYKHVPMSEENPVETIKNNVFGTHFLVEAAKKAGVRKFVLISTDKTVEPVNIYGASKKICEEIVSAGSAEEVEFMVVRFGNVLGSRGSIVPLFKRQIQKGGPVTVTHPEAERFFMTIPEAVSLVLTAGGMGKNGGLYLLDMGRAIKMRELAQTMIRFYGFEPETEIPLQYIGLRPGEKISEQLHSRGEQISKTGVPRINKITREQETGYVRDLIRSLEPVCFLDPEQPGLYRNRWKIREIIRSRIPTLEPREHETEY
ncbi:MAG: polysaccharide biosynthesis protein [Spirochaetia bacterium]